MHSRLSLLSVISMVCPSATAAAVAAVTAPRYVMYFDQYHTTTLPNNTVTAGITHVITAFANSSLFASDPVGKYAPFMNLTDVRALFDNGTKVCMAVGGWGDTEGFRLGAATDESRSLYASNIATTLDNLGYDCIDIDWEYPGGNGYDYKQVPNDGLTAEIESYPLLLSAIKCAIGTKELSIAVPGLTRDMIAYTAETVPAIDAAVDFVNVMAYDLMNRRDNYTSHHTSVAGSLSAIEAYLDRGMTAAKMNLGIAFYAKYFTLAANTTCASPVGCPVALLENADGTDAGLSGAFTFETANFAAAVPANLTESADGSCGAAALASCPSALPCCSAYGWCGDSSAHCGAGCQPDYGAGCADPDAVTAVRSFADALAGGAVDAGSGGAWYVDEAAGLFWTWETPGLVAQKFADVVAAKGLGGVMAWSLAEDSHDWGLLLAMQKGVREMSGGASAAAARGVRRGGRPGAWA